jgi:DNA-directed RNA polymerase specialized sigma24 family protein
LGLNRPRKSATEIDNLPPPGTTEREAHIRAHGGDFAPETLVFLLRETAAKRDTALFEGCAIALVGHRNPGGRCVGGHCEGIILSMAGACGFRIDRETLNDFRQACHLAMWRAIRSGCSKKPFWEERFGLALKQLCIDEARKMSRRLDDLERAGNRVELTEEMADGGQHSAVLDDQLFDRIVEQELHAVIRRLPPRQAHAAFLAWVEGRPIGSEDPSSVKNVMGISERAVYSLLNKAKARLVADPQIRKYLENH